MKKLFVAAILAFLLTACLGSAPTQTDVDTLGTVVAGTLTAMPSATSTPEPTATEVVPTFTPEPSYVLPRSLYYLAKDASGNFQIYRLERDGVTVTQISDIDNGVSGFDVSSVDGSIAFIAKNRLFISDSSGGNRNPVIEDIAFESLSSPRWSPDGQTIAYSNEGIYLYSIENDSSILIFNDKENCRYCSLRGFSPDGTKLIISVSGVLAAIYDIPTTKLSPFKKVDPFASCCGLISWSMDSKYFYMYDQNAAGGVDGISFPGLWIYKTDGTGNAMLSVVGPEGTNIANKVSALRQDLNGDLVYLFSPPETGIGIIPLSLVRSGADGVTNRVVIRPETFFVSDTTLWTPDGNALLILQTEELSYRPVNLILVPMDPSRPIITLIDEASTVFQRSLHWGP